MLRGLTKYEARQRIFKAVVIIVVTVAGLAFVAWGVSLLPKGTVQRDWSGREPPRSDLRSVRGTVPECIMTWDEWAGMYLSKPPVAEISSDYGAAILVTNDDVLWVSHGSIEREQVTIVTRLTPPMCNILNPLYKGR